MRIVLALLLLSATAWGQINDGVTTLNNPMLNNSFVLSSTTLPTCNTANVGLRRSGNKGCWCDSTAWRNIAPAGLLSVLGVNVVVADTCP